MKRETCLNDKLPGTIAGVDIGNSSTEVALAVLNPDTGCLLACQSALVKTTGTKGTLDNMKGIKKALQIASKKAGIEMDQIDLILLNEAAPVIGSFAMETITETIITDSSVIGHNPDTPGGIGIGKGRTIRYEELVKKETESPQNTGPWILIVPAAVSFAEAAETINRATKNGQDIQGAIMQKNDGVLVANRLEKIIPIVDEVEYVEKIPVGLECVVEVADPGTCIRKLSDPYGIAQLFGLSPEETKSVIAIARALIGIKSAVVIKTPKGSIRERVIPSGELIFAGERGKYRIDVKSGAKAIMREAEKCGNIEDVQGTMGTNVGGMIENIRTTLSQLTGENRENITINDLFAVDTVLHQKVKGGLAKEFFFEHAVGIAAMVKTKKNQMERIAAQLFAELNVPARIGGVEAEMAVTGALTTPGAGAPIVVADIGAGSTDVCVWDSNGTVRSVHLAGAGNMVTMMINSELNLENMFLAEEIKKHPVGTVESFYHIRYEDGDVRFFDEPLSSEFYGRQVIASDGGRLIPFDTEYSIEKIQSVRRRAKKEVILRNIVRGLQKMSPTGLLSHFQYVVLVGGSALDFELGNMVTEELAYYGITAGKANVRGCEGPRNAVATGLILTELEKRYGHNQ